MTTQTQTNVIANIITEKNLTDWQAEVLNFLWENRETISVVVNVVSVSKSGMSRKLRFGIAKNNKFIDITKIMAIICNEKFTDDHCLKIGGCGMDMIWATLNDFYITLEGQEFNNGQAFSYTVF